MGKEFRFDMGPTREFSLAPYLPYDPQVMFYGRMGNMMIPFEYTGWLDETMSWKKTCYLHTGLSMRGTWITIKGPDAERLLSENSVCDFSTLKTGHGRHIIFCNPLGHIMGHGIILRLGEDEFCGFGCEQMLMYLGITKGYNIEPVMPEFNDYVFQIGGPNSLQVIENACHEDFHDLKFMSFRYADIAGHTVRLFRVGMAGTLAYEVHGTIDTGLEVYDAIWEAGKPFGIRRLGEFYQSYFCQHTENGFPQSFGHFYNAFTEDPEFMGFYRAFMIPEHPGVKDIWDAACGYEDMEGTLGDNLSDYYRNPFELGWGYAINWHHEFVGKEALKKMSEGVTREPVTLNWNAEDVLDVHASYLRDDGEPYMFMGYPRDHKYANFQLRVEDKDGNVVGVTSLRTYTLYQRKHISLCCLDPEQATVGNEVIVIWGDKDKYPIKRIRAKVAPFPSLDLPRNKDYDVESIPHYVKNQK